MLQMWMLNLALQLPQTTAPVCNLKNLREIPGIFKPLFLPLSSCLSCEIWEVERQSFKRSFPPLIFQVCWVFIQEKRHRLRENLPLSLFTHYNTIETQALTAHIHCRDVFTVCAFYLDNLQHSLVCNTWNRIMFHKRCDFKKSKTFIKRLYTNITKEKFVAMILRCFCGSCQLYVWFLGCWLLAQPQVSEKKSNLSLWDLQHIQSSTRQKSDQLN